MGNSTDVIDIVPTILSLLPTFLSVLTVLVSISALAVSIISLRKTRNQRRPYLSLSFDAQAACLCLSNYGGVPALFVGISFSEADLVKLKASDGLGTLFSGKEPDVPFKDMEGTVIGPGMDYCFAIDASAEEIKKSPYITATLKYGPAKHPERLKATYSETFKMNLRPKQGYFTETYLRHLRESSGKDQ